MWRPVVRGTLLDAVRAGRALTVGVVGEVSKPITHDDVVTFANLLGDNNPVHLDAEYAKTTRWGGPIAHGMISAGLIGTVFGATIPGSIYMSQTLKFRKPVPVGDTVTAKIQVVAVKTSDKIKGQIVTCSTVVRRESDKEVVVDGEATVMIPQQQQLQ